MTHKLNTLPYILSVAGFDSSGGAGIVADVKVFNTLHTFGISVCTAITYQTHNQLYGVDWLSVTKILRQLKILLEVYSFDVCKIGVIKNLKVLKKITNFIKLKSPRTLIIWDPIFKSSTGFLLTQKRVYKNYFKYINAIDIITPNQSEFIKMEVDPNNMENKIWYVKSYSQTQNTIIDVLYKGNKQLCQYTFSKSNYMPKHGSGCVFSSALASFLGKGNTIVEACEQAGLYTQEFLKSDSSLLGFHS